MAHEQQGEALAISLESIRAAAARIDGLAHRTPVLTCGSLDALAASTQQQPALRLFFKVREVSILRVRRSVSDADDGRGAVREPAESGGVQVPRRAQRRQEVPGGGGGRRAAHVRDALERQSRPGGGAGRARRWLPRRHRHGTCGTSRHQPRRGWQLTDDQLTDRSAQPNNAPEAKQRAVEGYGAAIERVEPTLEARDAAAHAAVAAAGLARFVHPSNDPDVMSGQGTVGLELLEQAGQPLDAVLVPVGGGGLLSGVAMAVKVSSGVGPRCG